jgi:hypothetical protein
MVAHPCCLRIPLLKGDARFEILAGIGQELQLLIGCFHSGARPKALRLLVAITLAFLPLGIRDRLRAEARAMEVDVRVEEVAQKALAKLAQYWGICA